MTYQEKIEQVIGIIQQYKKDMPEQEYKDILRTIIEDLQKNFKELGFNIFIEGRMLKNNLGILSRVFAQKIVIQFEQTRYAFPFQIFDLVGVSSVFCFYFSKP